VATQEKVTLKIEINTDVSQVNGLATALRNLDKAANNNNRSFQNMGRSIDRTDRKMTKLGRTFQGVGKMAFKFISILTKFSFLAYAGQVAVLTTALLGAKLAMATGRVAAQGYSIALKGVATAATAAATAVAIAAASMRQFQEAQLSPFTGGVGGAATRNRSLSPMLRGLMGSEASQQALRGLSKAGVTAGSQNAVLRELFNISGGDSKQVVSLIGALQGDPGTFKEAVGASAGGAAAANRAGDLQGQELIRLLASGGLTSGTNFANLDNVMGQTVVGTLKTEMQSLLSIFSDAGEGLLGPTRDTIRLLSSTVAAFTQRSIPLIMKFGDMVLGSQGLASGLQKMSDSLFRMMEDTLPRLEGFMDRMSGMARSTRMFFRDMANAMRPLEAGAEVLMDMFGNIFGGMVGNGVLDNFNRTLTQNAASFEAFGESIGNVFRAFFAGSGGGDSMVSVVDRMTNAFNQFAVEVVPPLKEIANSIKDIILNALPPVLTAISNILATLAPLVSALAAVSGAGGGGAGALMLMGGMAANRRFGRQGRMARAAGMAPMPMGGARFGAAANRIGTNMMTSGRIGNFVTNPAAGAGRAAMASRLAPMVGGGMLAAGGIGGAMLLSAGIGDAHRTGGGMGSTLTSAAGGAMLGATVGSVVPIIGTAAGAVIGGALGAIVSGITGDKARDRRENNLNAFFENNFNNTRAAADQLAVFNHTLENFEEIAQQNDMSAEDLKERLDALKPTMDEVSSQIESKVKSRVELLTETFGFAADEAEQLARTLGDVDFNEFSAGLFNAFAADALSGFGFATRFERTSANKSNLRQAQGGLEASLMSQFGGDLDLAASSEEGLRQIEALFNNIVSQSMLVEGQDMLGAEMTAISMLEKIFGSSDFVNDLVAGNEELIKENDILAELLGEGNLTLETIAERLDFAFGGGMEEQVRTELGGKFDRDIAQQYEGRGQGYAQAQYLAARREEYINDNIGTAMAATLSISNPISVGVGVSGVLTDDAVARIQKIVDETVAQTEKDLRKQIADSVNGNSFSEEASDVFPQWANNWQDET
jgi:hypothetical protein